MLYNLNKYFTNSGRAVKYHFTASHSSSIKFLKLFVKFRSFGSNCILQDNSNLTIAPHEDKSVNTTHPWFITGFCDAEGSFCIKISTNKKLKLGYSVIGSFQLTLHSKDSNLLFLIQSFF